MATRKPKPEPKPSKPAKPPRDVSKIITGPCSKTSDTQLMARSLLKIRTAPAR